MSFWGKVFGTEQAITTAVNSVRDGLDALVYTDEEKAVDAAKERTEARGMIVEWMRATQGQNLARRLIALAVTGTWLVAFILSYVFAGVAIFVDDGVKFQAASTLLQHSANQQNDAVMLILAFYFAAPHMGGIVQAVLGRMSKDSVAKG